MHIHLQSRNKTQSKLFHKQEHPNEVNAKSKQNHQENKEYWFLNNGTNPIFIFR